MSLSVKPCPEFQQAELLPDLIPDKPLSSNGEARSRYGAVVNECVNAILGLVDIPNSGSHDVVYDAYRKDRNTYVEVKSLRRRNKLPLYEWRRKKDEKAGVPLVYAIGIHDVRRCTTLGGCWLRMSETLNTIFVLPHGVVSALAEPHKLVLPKPKPEGTPRDGSRRPGYHEGYRNIPYDDLSSFSDLLGHRYVERTIRGLEFGTHVYFHPSITPWL